MHGDTLYIPEGVATDTVIIDNLMSLRDDTPAPRTMPAIIAYRAACRNAAPTFLPSHRLHTPGTSAYRFREKFLPIP